ncbi:zinc finger protein 395-like [Malurus melanocephalus]|uniref:zinc finger protein 395-like n=1 Tax=Malurus melanocephalus TaxID=175006 RepID=UPI002549336C|nr:zinc finger protein 395-like [Malurus melanocephalus]
MAATALSRRLGKRSLLGTRVAVPDGIPANSRIPDPGSQEGDESGIPNPGFPNPGVPDPGFPNPEFQRIQGQQVPIPSVGPHWDHSIPDPGNPDPGNPGDPDPDPVRALRRSVSSSIDVPGRWLILGSFRDFPAEFPLVQLILGFFLDFPIEFLLFSRSRRRSAAPLDVDEMVAALVLTSLSCSPAVRSPPWPDGDPWKDGDVSDGGSSTGSASSGHWSGGSATGSPKNCGVSPKNCGVSTEHCGVRPENCGVSPKNSGVGARGSPKHCGVSPKHYGVNPKHCGVSPTHCGSSPKHCGVSPEPFGVGPEPFGVSPTWSGINPKHCGVSPEHCGVSPTHCGISPEPLGVSPELSGVSPEHCGGSPTHCGISPESFGVSPEAFGVSPSPPHGSVSPNPKSLGAPGAADEGFETDPEPHRVTVAVSPQSSPRVLFKCLWPGCGKELRSTVGIRRHVRTLHLGVIPTGLGSFPQDWGHSQTMGSFPRTFPEDHSRSHSRFSLQALPSIQIPVSPHIFTSISWASALPPLAPVRSRSLSLADPRSPSLFPPQLLVASPPRAGPGSRKSRGEAKKCRKVYGVEHREQWCTACRWKKACQRFLD